MKRETGKMVFRIHSNVSDIPEKGVTTPTSKKRRSHVKVRRESPK